jgi:hypothetical protein
MATLHHNHPPVRNGLLAALPSEDLARLRPSLQPVELPFDQTLYPADGIVEAVQLGLKWSSQHLRAPISAARQRPRQAFATRASCAAGC